MKSLFFAHIASAYLSLILLLIRGLLSVKEINWRRYKLLRIAPHIIDTLLLISGIGIFLVFGFSILQVWIWLKLVFILLYITFSILALKQANFSITYFILAITSFLLVVVTTLFK
ncbi:SirB2 family protein [Otariodibacter oris]|uniref:Putative membrane protein SirB2 n=1 Tax=Otariodibacter oris TaxID=1032623 RepID=A0A420XIV4_9PAST|nr:SirB2 family protein [Otariodibacter oris]QGM80744.1 invasion protein expression up-regulator SirB [Otariodibacter oris]RKR77091.1 putative membrane protein SirB2 [Otariodibacter oris]